MTCSGCYWQGMCEDSNGAGCDHYSNEDLSGYVEYQDDLALRTTVYANIMDDFSDSDDYSLR